MREYKRTLPSLSYVVARSKGAHVIGCENKLPWRLGTDLKNFKKTTQNHVVIMGRMTFESIGRPLPNRINIVLSREGGDDIGESLIWAKTPEDALFLADHYSILMNTDEVFVVGGEGVYTIFEKLFNKVHLTEVDAPSVVGDSFFKYRFNFTKWNLLSEVSCAESEVDEYSFTVSVMERRCKFIRSIDVRDFFAESDEFSKWRSDHTIKIKPRKVELSVEQIEFNFAV